MTLAGIHHRPKNPCDEAAADFAGCAASSLPAILRNLLGISGDLYLRSFAETYALGIDPFGFGKVKEEWCAAAGSRLASRFSTVKTRTSLIRQERDRP